jgi:hypothetical protein
MRKWMVAGVMIAMTASGAAAQTGQLSISGTSTVRSWTCSAAEFDAVVRPAVDLGDVLRGEKVVSSVVMTFPVARIDCGNGKMDEHLRKALKAEQYPSVTYELSAYEIATAADGATVQTTGRLTIAGTSQSIRMNLTLSSGPNGQLRVRGETPLAMTTYGVKPPTLMMGTLKVGDAVTVKFDVMLSASTVASVAAAARN